LLLAALHLIALLLHLLHILHAPGRLNLCVVRLSRALLL